MGEFADMAVDQALNGDYWDWDMDGGERDADDWGAPWIGNYRRYSRRKIPTCKYCNESHLHWGKTSDDRWRLEDWNGTEFVQHTCKMRNRWKSNTATATSSQQKQGSLHTVSTRNIGWGQG